MPGALKAAKPLKRVPKVTDGSSKHRKTGPLRAPHAQTHTICRGTRPAKIRFFTSQSPLEKTPPYPEVPISDSFAVRGSASEPRSTQARLPAAAPAVHCRFFLAPRLPLQAPRAQAPAWARACLLRRRAGTPGSTRVPRVGFGVPAGTNFAGWVCRGGALARGARRAGQELRAAADTLRESPRRRDAFANTRDACAPRTSAGDPKTPAAPRRCLFRCGR